jgi:hypothetical protein
MPRQKDRYDNRNGQFPIHYENGGIRIFTNSSGEIFVEQVVFVSGRRTMGSGGVLMRFSPNTRDGLCFTTAQRVEPKIIGNTIGWHVVPR